MIDAFASFASANPNREIIPDYYLYIQNPESKKLGSGLSASGNVLGFSQTDAGFLTTSYDDVTVATTSSMNFDLRSMQEQGDVKITTKHNFAAFWSSKSIFVYRLVGDQWYFVAFVPLPAFTKSFFPSVVEDVICNGVVVDEDIFAFSASIEEVFSLFTFHFSLFVFVFPLFC